MGWLQSLAAELAITMADGTVWLSIGQALLAGGVCLLFGIWVARFVGLLEIDAPAGETIGVGLTAGLLVLAAWWAAIWSGGRSSFTPVAVGFAIAIVLAATRRWRARREPTTTAKAAAGNGAAPRSWRHRNLVLAVLGSAMFVIVVALLYGSTLTLSPRDGVQPLEFNDTAFYSILGADLARTGTETIYSPSGFAALEGLPAQTWYHWGELWLGSALITIFGMSPLAARHFVVLPLLLLAAAALTGTVVRRLTGASSRGAFLFGFLACLFLAPVPVIAGGPFFGAYARGMMFGITAYGLAAVAVLLAIYGFTVLGRRPAAWTLACFVASAAASIIPAHIVVALLALIGLGSAWAVRIGRSLLVTRRLPEVEPVWRMTFVATGVVIVATVAWGVLTGHGVGGSGLSSSVAPFNASWRESVAITTITSGAFFAIAAAWFLARKDSAIEADLYLGTVAILVIGALVWGALLGDFTMVHLFYAGIATFAIPAAAVAVWSVWRRLRVAGHARLAVVILVLCVTQIELGVVTGVIRLQDFGPRTYPPLATELLEAIGTLPTDAKLAYACLPSEEVAFWEARLLAVDAHAARRMVPMCFQAETNGVLTGTPMSSDVPSPLFRFAPQRELYPDSKAQPSVADIASFLKANGIGYIYVDAMHPNTLIPDATPILTSGETEILRIP